MTRNNHPARRLVAQGLATACALTLALAGVSAVQAAQSEAPSLSGVVNLNTATPEELQLLPGVGEVRAVAIVAMRKRQGGFQDVDDLLEVKGIGQAMLKRMRPHVTLSGKTTARKL
ncbi:MAG: ComEA family DNA-binding protein [Myxococcota bacterium]|nr:ComEA family DNA-binding protein [Myxococcota bacterium]